MRKIELVAIPPRYYKKAYVYRSIRFFDLHPYRQRLILPLIERRKSPYSETSLYFVYEPMMNEEELNEDVVKGEKLNFA